MDYEATLRKFTVADIAQILEIEKQAFPKTAYSREVFFHFANALPDGFILIEKNKETVGYIIFETDGHILSTAVAAKHRRRGIGRMLFTYALRHSRKKLWLEVRSKNISAITFYKNLGMEIIGTIPNYYGTDDALIMRVKLPPPEVTV